MSWSLSWAEHWADAPTSSASDAAAKHPKRKILPENRRGGDEASSPPQPADLREAHEALLKIAER